jgi:hypothetical protein
LFSVLFAVGLTIYLWNIHVGVAIPVLVVTLAATVAYGISTALPLFYRYCPYSSPLSKLVDAVRKPDSDEEGQNLQLMDKLTSRALSWLIINYEDTQSADIAIQAIAGASKDLPLDPLNGCKAISLLSHRIRGCVAARQKTGKRHLKDPGLLESVSLYSRAVCVWGMRREGLTLRQQMWMLHSDDIRVVVQW